MNNFSYSSFVSIHYIICECGDTFATEKSLQQHLENEHKTPNHETNEYQCSTCGKVFSTERACIVHQKVHVGGVRVKREPRDPFNPRKRYYTCKNIVCEVCGKRYASNAALRYHQRVHTGERPYQCPHCPKTFTMPLFLQIHIRTHTGERPYQCPMCPKAFSNKAALLRHDRVHTGVKPYECPRCGKFFTQSNSMKLHVKTVHLKMPAPYKSKNRKAKLAMRQGNLMPNIAAKEVTAPVAQAVPTPVPMPVTVTAEKIKYHPRIKMEDEEEAVKEEAQVYEGYESNEDGLCEEVKIEITEIPNIVYEEDLEDSEVVYEEDYDSGEM